MQGLDISILETLPEPSDSGHEDIYDVIIIGGGPAGATAALYSARAQLRTLVIDKGLTAGALGMASQISNYPGIREPIDGAELNAEMRAQAQSFGAEFIVDKVIGMDLSSNPRSIFGGTGMYSGRAIILATGSMGRTRTVPGEKELLGHGVSYCATCDGAFFRDRDVAVVGNNDEALEEALFLTRFASNVELIVAGADLVAQADMIAKVNAASQIHIHYQTRLRNILGAEKVEAIRIQDADGGTRELALSGVFLYTQGAQPISDYVQDQIELGDKKCVQVDGERRTRIEGVFAVGDLLCDQVKQIVVAASDGAVAAISAEKYLRGREKIKLDWQKKLSSRV